MLPDSFAKGGKEKRCCLSVFPFFFTLGEAVLHLLLACVFFFHVSIVYGGEKKEKWRGFCVHK